MICAVCKCLNQFKKDQFSSGWSEFSSGSRVSWKDASPEPSVRSHRVRSMGKKKSAKAGAAPAPAPAGSTDLVPLRRELAKSLCGETAEARSAVVSRIASLLTDGPDVATISAEVLLRLVQRGEQRESLRRVGVPLLVQSLTRHANVVRLIAAAAETLNHLVNGSAPLLLTAQSGAARRERGGDLCD